MASIGTLYGPPQGAKVTRVLAAAKVNGLQIDFEPTLPVVDSHKPEVTAKGPLGKVPVFEGSDGLILTESRAILRYGTYTYHRKDRGEVQGCSIFQLSLA